MHPTTCALQIWKENDSHAEFTSVCGLLDRLALWSPFYYNHTMRVINYAASLCENEDSAFRRFVIGGAAGHDIGKLRCAAHMIDGSIWTPEDFVKFYPEVQKHPLYGHVLLRDISLSKAYIARNHHRHDGYGTYDFSVPGMTHENREHGLMLVELADCFDSVTMDGGKREGGNKLKIDPQDCTQMAAGMVKKYDVHKEEASSICRRLYAIKDTFESMSLVSSK